MKKFLVVVLVLTVAGCSSTLESQCTKWHQRGQVVSTMDSCKQCLDTLGPSNIDAIRGCALGLDAAKLLQPQGR